MGEIRRTPRERATRIALHLRADEEEAASRLWVHDLEMRIGDVPVRMGGIGGVGTNDKHRMKGYARRVMEDANAFMLEAGYDVALLFGIRDFYTKFGYAVCVPECEAELSTRYAERAEPRLAFAPAGDSDTEPVRRLYEETNSSRTGSVVRREGAWKGFERGTGYHAGAGCFAATDGFGELQAYVVLDRNEDETRCAELAARTHEGYEAALRFLAEDAIAKRTGSIRVVCPYDHPFMACASGFGVNVEVRRHRCGGGMGRIIDQRTLFEKLAPLLSRRLRSSGLRGEKFAVTISTELGRTTVDFDGEEAALGDAASAGTPGPGGMCEVPAPGLMQLVMGYADRVSAGAKAGSALAARAIDAMFPRQEAHTWRPDRF